MEFNEYRKAYESGSKQKHGMGGFGVLVLVLLGVLIATSLVAVSVFRNAPASDVIAILPETGETYPVAEPTPAPTAIPNPNPTASPKPDDREVPALDGQSPVLANEDNPIPAIFEAVSPSVVGVVNYTMQSFGGKQMMAIYGSGSGFIVSQSGYILTNAHVVEDAQAVTVMLPSGEEIEAAIIGADEETDVAVLKVEHENLKALALGDSDQVRVGEFVLAIGNPLDTERLANTLTYGIISANSREVTIDSLTNTYIQTDAAINFGNSGGPLLNLKGEVIGMNSAKTITAGYDAYGNPVSAEGIGFALPINTVVEIMEQLIQHGEIERPAIGVTVYTLTEAIAAERGLDVSAGVYVESVVKDGPASKAGLRAGDVIVAVNGREITEMEQLVAIIGECSIGDTLQLRINRNGREMECDVYLGNKTAMDFEKIEGQNITPENSPSPDVSDAPQDTQRPKVTPQP